MFQRRQGPLDRLFSAVAGDPRFYSLEHRLFNTISLLNGITNIGGALFIVDRRNYTFLLLLTLGTGLLFLVFYYVSRFRHHYRALYWPFVLLIAAFLFLNALRNAGSMGGAHYYFIPALVIAVVLSRRRLTTGLAMLLFTLATAALLLIERRYPEWVAAPASPNERLVDILVSLLFVQVFTGVLVMLLAKNLNQERKKTDTLLLNILPESVARELQQNDRVQPLDYDCASVLFTDFVGFTQIAESLTPHELIEELDTCFRQFDEIASRHRLEKIKTIGDAYMAVGGIPQANHTHAVDCVLAALEITRFMAKLRETRMAADGDYWQLRLGIHSGRLVAGVIGQQKFAYDVWGDTVNTASRLESSGVAGRVNISKATYERVKEFFDCEYRGAVAAKHKGEIEMYFVNRIRPELSRDEAGQTPGEKFYALYERMKSGEAPAKREPSRAE
ncbi:MAG TPA: adenylate/guanylate cyclase domain-containing protein [Blastocatellia bacterium]|nr:adenylate/guanylate cyclase domain-containing protein [Blastocatellia bacterium]